MAQKQQMNPVQKAHLLTAESRRARRLSPESLRVPAVKFAFLQWIHRVAQIESLRQAQDAAV